MKAVITENQEDIDRIQQFVKLGNAKAVQNWIEKGKPVFCTTGTKLSPLANSIRFKRRVIFAKLLELDYSDCPHALASCLSYAVRMERIKHIKALIEKGVDVEAVDWYRIGESSLTILRQFLDVGKTLGDEDSNIFNDVCELRQVKVILEYRDKYPRMDYFLMRSFEYYLKDVDDLADFQKYLKVSGIDPRRWYKDPECDDPEETGESIIQYVFRYANLPALKYLKIPSGDDDINWLAQHCWRIDRDFIEYLHKNGLNAQGATYLFNHCLINCEMHDVMNINIDDSSLSTAERLIDYGAKLTLDDEMAFHSFRKYLARQYEYSVLSIGKKLLTTSDPDIVLKLFNSVPIQRNLGMHLSDIRRRLRIKKSDIEKAHQTKSTVAAPKKKTRKKRTVKALSNETVMEGKISVPSRLNSPHELIKETARELRIAKIEKNRLIPHNRCLPISVSLKAKRRALLIFNAILKEAEKREFMIGWFHTGYNEYFGFTIYQERVGFKLSEVGNNKTPKLVLEVHHTPANDRHEWTDSPDNKIESLLDEFFDFIEEVATKARDERLARELTEKKAEEERQYKLKLEEEAKSRKEKFLALKREEQQKLEKLRSDCRNWHESQLMRQYIEAVKKQSALAGLPEPPAIQTWIEKAQKFADRIDPFTYTPPSIMDLDLDNEVFNRSWEDIESLIKKHLSES